LGRQWTKPQNDAICARGGTLLVRAAAGSGKTAVLVERVVSMITDPQTPVDVDRLIVATFSNAAAQEMRGRISDRIEEILLNGSGGNRLRKQQLLLETAQIGTVHSFCLRLIRENPDQLGLPSDMRIADEAEMMQLKQDVLDEYLEQRYEHATENFHSLVELLSEGRSDRNLKGTICKLYDFMRSHPFYEKWMQKMLDLYNPEIYVEESVWGKEILNYAVTVLTYLLSLAESSLRLLQGEEKLQKAYADSFEACAVVIGRMLEAARNKKWDVLTAELHRFTVPALKAVRGCENEQLKKLLQENKKTISAALENLRQKQFFTDSAGFREDITELAPMVKELFTVTLEYDKLLQKRKQAELLMDFSDMEQYALTLLYTEDPEGNGYLRSDVAKACAAQYEAVFVDEYQDTNAAQDMIFRAISRDEKNIFMVGDVKQSIYRFRQAMPEIFIEKQERFSPFEEGVYPANIVLRKNFRSMPAVLSATNYVFEKLMSKDLGEVDYNEEERLIPDEGKPSEGAAHLAETDFVLIDTNDDTELETSFKEAAYIASEIKRMIAEGFVVFDKEGPRKAEQRDFAILLRSKSNRAEQYIKALTRAGLSVNFSGEEMFFALSEISLMMSMLRVIDNPLTDIALAAVLLSEMFGFAPSDLAQIRLAKSRMPLFVCMGIRAGEGDEKCKAALERIARFRLIASTVSADVLLRKIYDTMDILPIMSGNENGSERISNLLRLIGIAADYESHSSSGLSGFLRYTDRMREDGIKVKKAAAASGRNSVNVMTIHASKGLEFPIVFVPDNTKKINKMDLYKKTMLHAGLGFACVRRDKERGIQFATVPNEALKLANEAELMSEELRVLYVAMTRARDKLIMTAAADHVQKMIENAAAGLGSGEISPYLVRRAESVSKWLLMVLLLHPDGKVLREYVEGFHPLIQPDSNGSRWNIRIAAYREEASENKDEKEDVLPSGKLIEEIKKRTAQCYPYAYATEIPNKLSVSELSHGKQAKRDFGRIPAFNRGNALTPAQKGTALHTFMQFADYRHAEEDPEGELNRLLSAGYITQAQRDAIETEHLLRFFESRLYRRMASAEKIYREFKFLYNEAASRLGFEGEDTITIQGIADCVFVENNRLIVVDYKTDRVKTEAELVQRYHRQLEVYADVLSQSFCLPVGEMLIYSLHLDCEITVAKNVELW